MRATHSSPHASPLARPRRRRCRAGSRCVVRKWPPGHRARRRCTADAAHSLDRRGGAGDRARQLDHVQRRHDAAARDACAEVMHAFFADGGRMVDSSPMYGSSQATIGYGLAQLGRPTTLFSADKVWIGDGARGAAQMEASRAYWGVQRFDLMQVHNLVAWQAHLPRLFAMKAAGRLRYVGITTSEGRRHAEIEQVMRTPAARFRAGHLQPARPRGRAAHPAAGAGARHRRHRQPALPRGRAAAAARAPPLPAWAAEIGCDSWAQVVLKFIVSHPAVTCAIPATSRVAHVRENMAAARGRCLTRRCARMAPRSRPCEMRGRRARP